MSLQEQIRAGDYDGMSAKIATLLSTSQRTGMDAQRVTWEMREHAGSDAYPIVTCVIPVKNGTPWPRVNARVWNETWSTTHPIGPHMVLVPQDEEAAAKLAKLGHVVARGTWEGATNE